VKIYKIELTGKTPLLMHADNIEWSDQMDDWKADPGSKKSSKAGDDRTPAWRWLGAVYHDGQHIAIPSDNIMKCAMEGGALVPVPGGKGNKTFKAQTQSGMQVGEPYWKLLCDEQMIPMGPINELMQEDDFKVHRETAAKLGFNLFLKRAKINSAKHVRVRPRFDNWSCAGTINVWDDKITERVLQDIWTYGGQYKGLGDWRPGGKTPGPWGMFSAKVMRVQ
jgi:hypothetical protein